MSYTPGLNGGRINVTIASNTAGVGALASTGTLTLAGGNNITLSQAGNAITISGGAGGNYSEGISTGGNSVGTSGTISNQMIWAGGNNITLSQATGAGGNTITISGPNILPAVTLSSWEPYPTISTPQTLSANTNTSGTASFIPYILDNNLSGVYMNMIQSMTMTTGGISSFNQSATLNYGLYTRGTGANSTTMSQITSGSYSYQMSYNNSTMTVSYAYSTATSGYAYTSSTSAGVNLTSIINGLKLIQLPLNANLSPGAYWLGLFDRASSSSFNSGIRYSYIGNVNSLTLLSPIGQNASAYSTGVNLVGASVGNMWPGFGVYTSVNQTNLPATVAFTNISQTLSVVPYIKVIGS